MSLTDQKPRIERFGEITEVIPLPNLTEVQVNSFKAFLQADKAPDERDDTGLQSAFREVFPIDETEKGRSTGLVLDFLEYRLGEPPYTPEECREKDLTYQAPLYAKLQLIHKDSGLIKEDQVFLGDLPLMTDDGSFVINGADRVVISQIHRSPGVYFTSSYKGIKKMYTAAIIPMPKRGPWIELEFNGGVLEMKVNKRKFPVSLLLRVLGYDDAQLKALFTEFDPTAELPEDKSAGMNPDEALLRLFTVLRPGDPPKRDKAIQYLYGLLADPKRYDLGEPGRFKMNAKLGTQRQERTLLTFEDGRFGDAGLVDTIRYLMALQYGRETVSMGADEDGVVNEVLVSEDDIDHLGNRRVRTVGELLADQLRVGMGRMARGVRERMLLGNPDAATPTKLVNNRPIVAAMREFFGRSQLSQFKDQTNPLSDLRHKRRISALGPGGLTRERAGFDVRDVHRTHYGRICPIETPEGANIGLISSLSSYAKVNDLGFIEAPYRRVVDGRVTDDVVYMTADIEDRYVIAQANSPLNPDGTFAEERVLARKKGDPMLYAPTEVDFMDVSPKQIVSINTSLIPFLEHDDANRALMGANMQRQAVPLVKSEAPLVGTGMEFRAALDSGDVVRAEKAGVVQEVSADLVTVANDDGTYQTYRIAKFARSNQGTSYNQVVVVNEGDRVETGGVIADGPATDGGEMALGRNLLVAFMSWEGHNYEDAIILSQRLVQDDVLSSIHIEEHEVDARDTKLGPEEITRDIPNVSEDVLADLDERGIIRVGAEVRDGDLLVGKVTPKGETELTPEERLLRAIFGEKAREVRDTSLKVPHGETGTVIGVKEFRADLGDDLPPGVNQLVRVYVANKRKITDGDKLAGRHGNKGVISKILPVEDMPFLEDGTPVDVILNPHGVPRRMNLGQILELHLGWAANRGWKIEGNPEWAKQIPADAHEAPPGSRVATPVFDGASEDVVTGLLDSTLKTRDGVRLIDGTGKTRLFDGRSGEPFPEPVAVGYMYILKLHHLVDDKIHARSTGPYSMITQQPLGGKAQFGGQRFGEMEVWALEAYGAAYTLQELLTIKSDDVPGRVKVYEAIVKGENIPDSGIPESFKVLLKEMQSLCLNVEVLNSEGTTIEMKESDEEVFRAAEELGIDLSRREPSSVEEV